MLNDAICDALLQFLGGSNYVGIVKLRNSQQLRKNLSLPSTLLAYQRFQAGVLSSRFDWIASGSLSGTHIALVLPEEAAHSEWNLDQALSRFDFVDPWGDTGAISLEHVSVTLPLLDYGGLAELFEAADEELSESERRFGYKPTANHSRKWCTAITHMD